MLDTNILRGAEARSGIVQIPGGTFRMGSEHHYAEEAPAHTVTVDDFWIDPTPVTNRQFRAFVEATGHVTFAEIAPDPKDYSGALPHMLTHVAVMGLIRASGLPCYLRRATCFPGRSASYVGTRWQEKQSCPSRRSTG
jgi:formylglycine-generating enzyme required for sulfatase activity